MGWVTADAPTEEELDACVRCGLCLPHCPTFRLTGKETASPRGRLMAMAVVGTGQAPLDKTFAAMMGFCLQCRACEAVCPSLVPFGRAMEGARAELAAQLPSAGRRTRHFVLGRVLAWRRGLRVATTVAALAQRMPPLTSLIPRNLRARFAGLRPLRRSRSIVGRPRSAVQHAAGKTHGVAAVLAGCVMDAWFPQVHEATIELLSRAGWDIVVPDAQTCCGALAAHEGAAEAARRLAAQNSAAFAEPDLIVANAAGCGAHLKEYATWADGGSRIAAKTRDVTEVIAAALQEGTLPQLAGNRGPIAVQDPCHLRHAQRIAAEPRAILAAAGYDPIEVDPGGTCCGAAGVYSILEPEASTQLAAAKANQIRSTGTTLVASANPGCEMQLRTHLGPEYRLAHPVEYYWWALQEQSTDSG